MFKPQSGSCIASLSENYLPHPYLRKPFSIVIQPTFPPNLVQIESDSQWLILADSFNFRYSFPLWMLSKILPKIVVFAPPPCKNGEGLPKSRRALVKTTCVTYDRPYILNNFSDLHWRISENYMTKYGLTQLTGFDWLIERLLILIWWWSRRRADSGSWLVPIGLNKE